MTATTTPAIDAGTLYRELLGTDHLFILDVRNEEEFARTPIEGRVGTVTTRNIPYFAFLEDEDAALADLPRDTRMVVVCAKGGSSEYVVDVLRANGFDAVSLTDGMIGWGNHYDIRDVVADETLRIVQIARPARGDLSFAIISSGEAALIDPLRHTSIYRDALAAAGATLTGIFDTHVHADHISGGPALARETGAPYYVHPYDAIHPIDMLPARIAYTPLDDGQQYTIGNATLTVIWYPGHTLGQVNFLLETHDGKRYMFTGDGIFLRSFGRPDLGGKGEEWTPMLYNSMYRRLPAHLTDDTMLLPAHFSALEEGDAQGVFAAPWSHVQAVNAALQHGTSLAAFSAFVLGNLPVFPPEYVEIKRVNIGLVDACEGKASELELGKNICALAH